MRKDLNRSLLVWPAAASAALIAGTWLQQSGRLETLRSRLLSGPLPLAADANRAADSGSRWSAPPGLEASSRFELGAAEADEARRRDYGTRAPKVPSRLADTLKTGASTTLLAPRIDERRELAGHAGTWHWAPDLDLPLTLQAASSPKDSRTAHAASDPADLARGADAVSPVGPAGSDETAGDRSAAIMLTLEPPRVDVKETAPPQVAASHDRHRAETGARTGAAEAEPPVASPEKLAAFSPALPGGLSVVNRPRIAIAAVEARDEAEREVGSGSGERTLPQTPPVVVKPVPGRRPAVTGGSPAGWPMPRGLEEQLRRLTRVASRDLPTSPGSRLVSSDSRRPLSEEITAELAGSSPALRWAEAVESRLEELASQPRVGSERAGALIEELGVYAAAGLQLAEQVPRREEQLEWLRAGHALSRRVAVWGPIWGLAAEPVNGPLTSTGIAVDPQRLRSLVEAVRAQLDGTGDPKGWESYLLLDQIAAAAEERGDVQERARQRALLAQRLLSRLQWHGLDPAHRRWLERESVQELAAAVRPWNRTAIDYARLLKQLEEKESDSIDLASLEIADAVQSLRFADRTEAVDVAEAINTHYRNANVRVAISESLLQRLLPAVEPQTVPVQAVLFGSRIRGVSHVESDLRLQLVPNPRRWSLRLQTLGRVHTRSTGRNGPVAVRTTGQSRFLAATPIEISERGIEHRPSRADVLSRSRLRGINSQYDGWPLIGSLVRGIAESRYEELKPQADRFARTRLRDEIEAEIDDRVEQATDEASERLATSLLGPLGKLRLDPMVVDMQTTPQRLLARYRLAGDWQLAAYTPRPRAPRTSLMSVQVHQSAINNTLEQLAPRDHSRSIEAMVQDVMELFERRSAMIPEDIPADVMIQFAATRPVTVEIEEGMLWITLRIMRLSRGEGLDLRRFIVRAAYRPAADGMRATLVREGHLSITGPNLSMRERLPARAIFNKVFSPTRPLPLTLPALTQHPASQDLAISQLELRDGWIGLAISEKDAPRIAWNDADE